MIACLSINNLNMIHGPLLTMDSLAVQINSLQPQTNSHYFFELTQGGANYWKLCVYVYLYMYVCIYVCMCEYGPFKF